MKNEYNQSWSPIIKPEWVTDYMKKVHLVVTRWKWQVMDSEDPQQKEVTSPGIKATALIWCWLQSRLEESCDEQPCCSPSRSFPGKPCRCTWKVSHQPAVPRWGGRGWAWPGWRCFSFGLQRKHRWRRWGRCCPPAGCPDDTHSKDQGPGRFLETRNPPWRFSPSMLGTETSEAHEERTET